MLVSPHAYLVVARDSLAGSLPSNLSDTVPSVSERIQKEVT